MQGSEGSREQEVHEVCNHFTETFKNELVQAQELCEQAMQEASSNACTLLHHAHSLEQEVHALHAQISSEHAAVRELSESAMHTIQSAIGSTADTQAEDQDKHFTTARSEHSPDDAKCVTNYTAAEAHHISSRGHD